MYVVCGCGIKYILMKKEKALLMLIICEISVTWGTFKIVLFKHNYVYS